MWKYACPCNCDRYACDCVGKLTTNEVVKEDGPSFSRLFFFLWVAFAEFWHSLERGEVGKKEKCSGKWNEIAGTREKFELTFVFVFLFVSAFFRKPHKKCLLRKGSDISLIVINYDIADCSTFLPQSRCFVTPESHVWKRFKYFWAYLRMGVFAT